MSCLRKYRSRQRSFSCDGNPEEDEDYEDAGEEWIVWTAANDVMAVSKALEEQGIHRCPPLRSPAARHPGPQ